MPPVVQPVSAEAEVVDLDAGEGKEIEDSARGVKEGVDSELVAIVVEDDVEVELLI